MVLNEALLQDIEQNDPSLTYLEARFIDYRDLGINSVKKLKAFYTRFANALDHNTALQYLELNDLDPNTVLFYTALCANPDIHLPATFRLNRLTNQEQTHLQRLPRNLFNVTPPSNAAIEGLRSLALHTQNHAALQTNAPSLSLFNQH